MRERYRWALEEPADQGGAPAEGADDRGFEWPDDLPEDFRQRWKDPVDVARGKIEADRVVSQTQGELAEARRQIEQYEAERAAAEEAAAQNRDPLREDLHQVIPDELAQNLARRFDRDPQSAYELAAQSEHLYGPELKNRVMAAWLQTDPDSAFTYKVNQMVSPILDERFQSHEDAIAERLGTTVEYARNMMNDGVVALVKTEMADFDEYEQRIEAMIDPKQGGNPALIADVLGDVRATADRIIWLRDSLAAGDMRKAALEAANPAAPPPPAAPARPRQQTLGQGSAPRPSNDAEDERVALMKENMRKVKAATLPGS